MHFDDVYDLVDAVVDRFSYEEDKHDKIQMAICHSCVSLLDMTLCGRF